MDDFLEKLKKDRDAVKAKEAAEYDAKLRKRNEYAGKRGQANAAPSAGERIGKTVTGAAKGSAAGYVNAGGVAVEGMNKVGTYLQSKKDTQQSEQDLELLAKYERDLKSALAAGDEKAAKTAQLRINAAQNRLKTSGEMTEYYKSVGDATAKSIYDTADALAESSQKDISRAKQGAGKVGQFAVDVGVAGTQMAGDMGLSLLTGGSALVPMAARSFGSGAQEARQAGASYGQQVAYGAGSAALSVATEKIANVAAPFKKAFGNGVLEKAIPGVVQKLSGSAAGKAALSMLSEGGEEMVEDLLKPILQRATYDPEALVNYKNADYWTNMLYDGLVGAVLGGVGAGMEQIGNRAAGNRPVSQNTPAGDMPADAEGNSMGAAENAARGVSGSVMERESQRLFGQQKAASTGEPVNSWKIDPLAQAIADSASKPQTAKRDILSELLSGGKRVDQSTLTQEQFDAAVSANEQGAVGMDASGKVYQVDPEQHIDRRTTDSVSSRGMNAFQFDHPELHSYFRQAAEALIADADLSLQFPMNRSYERTMQGNKVNQGAQASAHLRQAMDETGLSRAEIIDAAQRIVNDHGQENVKAAKQVEIILDAMLTNGWSTMMGDTVGPNQAYIDAKSSIAGSQPAMQSGEELPMMDDGLGNANAGTVNTAFDDMQARSDAFHPVNPNSAQRIMNDQQRAPSEVPTVNPDTGKNIGKTVSTILNSPLTSPEMAMQIESSVADGQFDYIPVTDREANLKAQQDLANRGLQTVADSFIAKVELGQRITKNDTASAIAAYNQAVADGNHALAFDLMTAIADAAHDSAQVVQSMNLMNRLTPEGRLLYLRRTVDKINRERNGKSANKTTHTDADTQVDADVTKAMQESLDDAYSLIRDIAEAFRRGGSRKTLADIVDRYPQYKNLARYFTDIDEYINGEKQSGWVETLGRELASKAGQMANPTPAKERTIYDTISGDLTAFMRQYVDNHRTTRKPRTAAERITDFFNNRNEYARAWATAKDSLRKKYSNNQQIMDRLEDFLYGTIGYNGSGPDTVMMKAVADAALDEDISIKEMTMRREYDRDAIVSQIADRLIRQTGARGSDADVIRGAVSRYVEEKIPQNDKTPQNFISRDIKTTMKDFGVKLSDILTKSAQSKEALAKRISDSLVKEYGISLSGAQSISEDISEKFYNMVSEASRKKVESMFKDRPKPVQKTYMQRFEEYANLGVFSGPNNEKAAGRVFGTEVRIDPELAKAYLDAKTDEARAEVMDNIIDNIASQIPSTFREKANFWRYTSMLLNPTTHVRNFMGNAIQAGARTIKNGVGAVIERAAVKDASQRTKAVVLGKEGKALRDFAKSQYEADKDAAMGAGKYSDASAAGINRVIHDKRKAFQGSNPLSKAVQAVGDFNTRLLDLGDVIFNKSAYVDSFAQALKAKGVTAAEAAGGAKADLVAQARAYAIEEAQKATYRNTTALSEYLSKKGRYDEAGSFVDKGAAIVMDALFPFRRTPSNVLTTGIDYSPVGLAKAITYDAYQVKAGNMSAADMVDHLSAGLTGTGILVLGAYLAAEGLLKVRTGDDDREKDYNQDRGMQDYSLQIGDKSYTLDWAVPAAMPLYAGAAIMESAREGGSGFDAVMDAIGGISEVVLETSMLSSLNDLISNWSYADNKALYLLDRTVTSYAGQYVPTVGGKIASAMDGTVRKSYVEKGTGQIASDLGYFAQSMEKKIPGARETLQPKVDLWGNEVSNGEVGDRLLQSFLSPGYFKTVDTSALDKELRRLAEATGSSDVYPSEVDKSFKLGKKTKDLTAEEYTKYAKAVGQARYQAVSALTSNSGYKKLTDEEKAKAITYAYEYATVKGKQAVSSYKPGDSSFAKGAMNSVLPIDSYILYKINADMDGNGSVSGTESAKALQSMSGLTDKQRWQEWARLNDAKDKADKASAAGLTFGEYASTKEKADANGDGRVTKEEAMKALGSVKNRVDLWDLICTTSAKNPYQ